MSYIGFDSAQDVYFISAIRSPNACPAYLVLNIKWTGHIRELLTKQIESLPVMHVICLPICIVLFFLICHLRVAWDLLQNKVVFCFVLPTGDKLWRFVFCFRGSFFFSFFFFVLSLALRSPYFNSYPLSACAFWYLRAERFIIIIEPAQDKTYNKTCVTSEDSD